MPSAGSPEAPYFDAGRLVAEVFEASFNPPRRGSVADWASEHRWLANEGGGYVGRWRHDIAPYLRDPMEVLTDHRYLTVAIVGPGQCGKTEVALNWLGAAIHGDPADMLWYLQTDAVTQAFVKTRIDPLLDDHAILRAQRGLRAVDDSLGFKRFRGMTIEFLGATRSAMINKRAPRIVADEWDAYDPGLGDPKALLDIRRQTYGRESKLVAISHPDLATGSRPAGWTGGIMALFAESDRRLGWWSCPECGAWSSPNPVASRVMAVDHPADGPLDEIAEQARLICPVNGCILDESHRRQMIQTLRWIGLGQGIDVDGTVHGSLEARDAAGFWITGLMSPFVMGGLGGLVRARVKASRESEATGSDESLRQVVVKQWGIPFDPVRQVGALDANSLADRAEDSLRLGVVPTWVRFLTAAVDIQANRFEILVRGWGPEQESCVVDHQRRAGDPATSSRDWDDLLGWLINAAWPLADGSPRGMKLRGIGYDSAGGAGVTQEAYAAWLRLKARRHVTLRGRVDGRDAWTVIPLKGIGTLGAQPLLVTYPDTARKDRRVVTTGQVPIGQFNANWFKDALAGQLARVDPGPRAIHLPAALRSPEPPHAWFEQLVAETRRKDGRWENPSGARNEVTDLMVMADVVRRLHQPAKLDWSRPPLWAAEWDRNALIVSIAAVARDAEAPAAPVVVAAPAPRKAVNRLDRIAAMLR
ncbi:terminase gpA endonuclease subunit [Rhodopila sp.]|uniref:terminase gpA endonuclease subunit n=1 Tax=Rhodopila sp. TaxID=2480087 RepID=UPI003D0D6A4D